MGGRCGIVGLAEAFDEFRVAEGADGVDFSRVLLEGLEIRVAGLVGHDLVDTVKVEVATADYGIELCIDGFEFEVRGADVPQPEIAVGVRVALYREYEVALDVGQQGQQTAVKRTAHQAGINSGEVLFGIGEGFHGILFGDGSLGIFVQTRDRADNYREHRHVACYVVQYWFSYSC